MAKRPERRTVLLAEDDGAMRALLAQALRRDGFDVVEVADGAALVLEIGTRLQQRREDRPSVHLIVSDIRMPVISGLEVLSALRQAQWGVPVVLITAFGDDEVHAEAERLGAVAVFDKPFDVDDFRTAVAVLGRAT